jgi:starch phosphorylase
MNVDVEYQAEMLAMKTKHYLITMMGLVVDEASDEEFFRALSHALREEIMINWLACNRTYRENHARMVYYFSMEYLPGRIFSNNITNLCADEIVRIVLQKMNRRAQNILNREADPGLGNGGLGRLASCFLDSLATLHYPARAYGLRYQYGIFEQQIRDGIQIEAPDCWLLSENPWEFRRDLRKVIVKYCGSTSANTNIHGDEVLELKNAEEVWVLPFDIPIVGYNKDGQFSVVTLRLWSTKESPRNFKIQSYNAGKLDQAAENTLLTDVLYPNDVHEVGKRIRLKQEFLLVSASLQDITSSYIKRYGHFHSFADKVSIQINDTHPALVIPELIRILTKKHDIPWKTAVDMVQAVTGYTNHTVMREAMEEWEQGLMNYLLPRQYRVIERLNHDFCAGLRMRYPNDEDLVRRTSILENGKVRMANLAIIGSHKVNGVAELHTEILKSALFKDFHKLYPDKFVNITNGVTQRRWLLHCNPELSRFITRRIGEGWITDFPQIAKLRSYADDPESQKTFMDIKRKNKMRLIESLAQENRLQAKDASMAFPLLDVNSLFDVQIKRIHEYKRQLLNLVHAIALYQEMLQNPHHARTKRTIIFGGKAAAGYETAKDTIRFIHCVARKINRDPSINGMLKILYIENYNVSKAEIIIPAADVSEQISVAGKEASGTGNMKLAINGALTVGTDDGANIEMRKAVGDTEWPFLFGASAEEIQNLKDTNTYYPRDLIDGNVRLKLALDALRDRTFTINDSEHYAGCGLYEKLTGMYDGTPADRFFVLHDFQSFYEVQKKVEHLYCDPGLWARSALIHMSSMGQFSSDVAVENYCKKIWDLHPMPIDEALLQQIRYEYSVLDVCRVYR